MEGVALSSFWSVGSAQFRLQAQHEVFADLDKWVWSAKHFRNEEPVGDALSGGDQRTGMRTL